ncbi:MULTISPECIES: hypothetical protein [unclassified Streptomyces]|uniref:hypothetical protein n=1 Tax=unclassified Streptomyces TaxID=2593676 RepID=UPI002E802032|nr:hypothetical protein [Streptomyces sp. NBC_00523]WUD00299.1 hypothetical protein OHS17_11890 [Streptomyces sp. NBC_00523]
MSSSANDNDPDDDFHLVDRYDSIEGPEQQSDFLDAIGTTRPRIEALRAARARRDAARTSGPDQEESPRGGEPRGRRRGSSRSRRRRVRVSLTHPSNRSDTRRPPRRRGPAPRRRTIVLVLVIELD